MQFANHKYDAAREGCLRRLGTAPQGRSRQAASSDGQPRGRPRHPRVRLGGRRASSPAPRTAHIDLWWQPAPSLDDARSACAATTRCTGVWWNERDSVYRRLSGAVAAVDARGAHADAYSVHTNACDVATFREALAASGADVAFVVTTVPRKGRGRYKGKTYFAAHLDTTLAQAPTLPVIYVQGDDASSDQAERIIGAAHGVGRPARHRGATGDMAGDVARPPPWPEEWRPPLKRHANPKWFARENGTGRGPCCPRTSPRGRGEGLRRGGDEGFRRGKI